MSPLSYSNLTWLWNTWKKHRSKFQNVCWLTLKKIRTAFVIDILNQVFVFEIVKTHFISTAVYRSSTERIFHIWKTSSFMIFIKGRPIKTKIRSISNFWIIDSSVSFAGSTKVLWFSPSICPSSFSSTTAK